jgi:hypothetical protein
LFKSCFLIFVMLHVWKAKLSLNQTKAGKQIAVAKEAS